MNEDTVKQTELENRRENQKLDIIGSLLLFLGLTSFLELFHNLIHTGSFPFSPLSFIPLLAGKWLLERRINGRRWSEFVFGAMMLIIVLIGVLLGAFAIFHGFKGNSGEAEVFGRSMGIELLSVPQWSLIVAPILFIIAFILCKRCCDFLGKESVIAKFTKQRQSTILVPVIIIIAILSTLADVSVHYSFDKMCSEIQYNSFTIIPVDADNNEKLPLNSYSYGFEEGFSNNQWFNSAPNTYRSSNGVVCYWLGFEKVKVSFSVPGYQKSLLDYPFKGCKSSITVKLKKLKMR